METVRIGSRESRLAVIQAEMVQNFIEENCPGKQVEIVTMKTKGDRILDRSLDEVGGKGLFVKELDIALQENKTDISVHSLKDMPMEIPEELPLIGFSKREDPRDVLVLPKGVKQFQSHLPMGCSSQRRIVQLCQLFPKVNIKSIRGNVITRLEKLDSGEYGGLILAAAGLKRLGLEDRISRYFTTEEMIPAAGQGILGLQGRKGEEYGFLSGFCDEESFYAAACERAFVETLEGGCSSPIAAHAVIEGERLKLLGLYYDEIAKNYITGTKEGLACEGKQIGEALAKNLKERFYEEK